MLSKATTKFIKSLQLKKYRKIEQLFVVEGTKSVQEVLNSAFKVKTIVATEDFIRNNTIDNTVELISVSAGELAGLGSFKTNDGAIAVVEQVPNDTLSVEDELAIALDNINDPGNLGTIIRVADWYGIKKMIVSPDTVELYNPKVIASSKGSFTRVRVYVTDLIPYIQQVKVPVYGAFISGANIHSTELTTSGLIVLGNEAQGISEGVAALVDQRITIPGFGGAESLNVAMAAAVICDNFRRKEFG